jgi:hypothetical protein
MIPPFDLDGDLPPGGHTATWQEFQERFCVFIHSDQRLQLCRRIAQLMEEARASDIVDRVIFGGSFVTGRFSTGQILTHFKVDICERLTHRIHHPNAIKT